MHPGWSRGFSIRPRAIALYLLTLASFGLASGLAYSPRAEAPTGVTFTAGRSATAGQPGIDVMALTPADFPSGTIHSATFIAKTRRIMFEIPSHVVVPSPTVDVATLEGSTKPRDSFFNRNAITLLVESPARLASITPNAGRQGTTLTITLTGHDTNFVQGATRAAFGPGIRVGGAPSGEYGPVTVLSPTHATAQVKLDSAAVIGPRTVHVKTGAKVASKADAFTVLGPCLVRWVR